MSWLSVWVGFCERHATKVLILTTLLTLIAAGISWRYSSIDSDLSKLIKPSDALPWYRDDVAYKAAFPQSQQTALIVVSGRDGAGVEAVGANLVERLDSQEQFEFVFAPAIDPEFTRYRPYFLEIEDLESWIEGVRYNYGVLLRLAESAGLANAAFIYADQVSAVPGLLLQHSLESIASSFAQPPPTTIKFEGYPHLVPGDEQIHYTLIVAKGVQEHEKSLPNAQLVTLIHQIVDSTPRPDSVQIRVSGEIVLADEEIRAGLTGVGLAGSISLVLLLVILWLGVRSWRVIGGMFIMLLVGVTLTLAFATLAIGSFNALALIFVVMFFGLSVDFAVHFILRIRESTLPAASRDGSGGESGRAFVSAGMEAAREVGPALVLCMATSTIAFLSFVPTPYRGLAELGIISAGGMVIALILTLTLIPAWFTRFGISHKALPTLNAGFRPDRLNPGLVIIVTLLLAVAASWAVKDLRFDYSVLALRDETTEAMSTLLELQSNDVVTDYSISVIADDLAGARQLKQRLEALPEVGDVSMPEDWIPDQQNRKRKLLEPLVSQLASIGTVLPAEYSEALPEAVETLREIRTDVRAKNLIEFDAFVAGLEALASQPETLAALNEELRLELIRELEFLTAQVAAQPFTLADLPEDLRARNITPDGGYLINVQPSTPLNDRDAIEQFVAAVSAVAPNIAGRTVVEWGVGGVVMNSFEQAITLSVTLILTLLVVYFRSISLALLVFVPLLLATLFSLAVAELVGLTLNMANILVVPLIFGLGVDTGIHVVHRFTREGSVTQLFQTTTARAVLISALTTIGTFFSLSFSPHKGAASIGLLLSIAISMMLLVTILVLTALLRIFGKHASGSRSPDPS